MTTTNLPPEPPDGPHDVSPEPPAGASDLAGVDIDGGIEIDGDIDLDGNLQIDGDLDEDPRIRERRIEVQRDAERKRVRIAVILAGVFVVAGLAYLAVESPALDVDHVRVTGAVHVAEDEIRKVAGIEHGEPLLRVDTAAVADRVGALPWVAGVDVARDLPGTLHIEVREHDAVAYARRADGKAALLAADGRVVSDVDVPPPGLVEVLGLRRPPAVDGIVSPPDAPGVVTHMPEALAQRIVAIDLAGDDVALDLVDGGEIRLGTLDDLEAKGAAALAVLDAVGDAECEYINVRVPENPAAKCSVVE